jgi:AcrR family transcriptional regulator
MEDGSVVTTVRRSPTGGVERSPQRDASPSDEPRRGRKKRQTRDALIDAALELFRVKGYERTAVHEITDAVDVAERTFFRYFASKEDLVLFFVKQQLDGFVDALEARPEGEAPLTAVRNAFRQTLEQLQGDEYVPSREARYLAVVKLIDSTPALVAASLRYVLDNSNRAVAVLAKRERVDQDVDRRPWLLIAIYGTVMALVHREWRTQGGGGAQAMIEMFDAYADQLGPTITGRWRTTDE